MATRIRDIVPVSFSISQPTFRSQAFNYPLILADTTSQEDRVGSYASLEAMTEAGFSSSEDAYIMAQSMFGQTSKLGRTVPLIKVGRKYKDANSTVTITFDADAAAGTFTISVSKENGTAQTTGAIAYDAVAGTIETAVEALSNVASVTCTINGSVNPTETEGITLEFDGADANTLFEVTAVDVSSLTTTTDSTITQDIYGSATEDWDTGFNAVVAADSEFWAVIPTTKTEADILDLAAAVEAKNNKFMWAVTADSAVVSSGTTDVASDLKAGNYKRSLIMYSEDTDYFANGCWAGVTLPDFLGAINPCYYPMSLLTADSLTDTEITYLVSKRVNRVESIGGVTVVPGTAAGQDGNVGGINCAGQFIDQVFAKDYLETRVSEEVYALLIQETRVSSLDQVDAVIRSTLQTEGVDRGIIIADTIDTGIDTATLNKTTRTATFPDGSAELEAAINKINISFKLY